MQINLNLVQLVVEIKNLKSEIMALKSEIAMLKIGVMSPVFDQEAIWKAELNAKYDELDREERINDQINARNTDDYAC